MSSTVSAIPKPTIRNVILCYKEYSSKSISMDSKDTLEYFERNCMKNCTLICVIASSDPDKIYPDLRKQLQSIAKHFLDKSVVIYGICSHKVS